MKAYARESVHVPIFRCFETVCARYPETLCNQDFVAAVVEGCAESYVQIDL